MRDINVVVLVGRLTRDAELKYTKSGTAIVRFSLAVNRSRKQDDQWIDETSFFDIDFWGKGAEAVNRYLTKGQQVAVEGELRQDRWEQDGSPQQGDRKRGQRPLMGVLPQSGKRSIDQGPALRGAGRLRRTEIVRRSIGPELIADRQLRR